MIGEEIVNGGNGGEGVGVRWNGEIAIEEAVAGTLGDLGLEGVDDLPLVLEKREIGEEAVVVVEEAKVDVAGTYVAGGGLEEHGLVEAAPDVLRGVDQVFDAAGNGVDGVERT